MPDLTPDVPADLIERLSVAGPGHGDHGGPLTVDERELVALHLDALAAAVRAHPVLEVDVDTDVDDQEVRPYSGGVGTPVRVQTTKTIRVVFPS